LEKQVAMRRIELRFVLILSIVNREYVKRPRLKKPSGVERAVSCADNQKVEPSRSHDISPCSACSRPRCLLPEPTAVKILSNVTSAQMLSYCSKISTCRTTVQRGDFLLKCMRLRRVTVTVHLIARQDVLPSRRSFGFGPRLPGQAFAWSSGRGGPCRIVPISAIVSIECTVTVIARPYIGA
jgi:hypothetical protein